MGSIFASIVRHILTVYGGATAAGGDPDVGKAFRSFLEAIANGDQNAIIAAGVTLLAVSWSIYEKTKKKRRVENEHI